MIFAYLVLYTQMKWLRIIVFNYHSNINVIPRSSSRVRLLTQEELVIAPVRLSDAGTYQCRVTTQYDVAQASAVVTLGGEHSQFPLSYLLCLQSTRTGERGREGGGGEEAMTLPKMCLTIMMYY